MFCCCNDDDDDEDDDDDDDDEEKELVNAVLVLWLLFVVSPSVVRLSFMMVDDVSVSYVSSSKLKLLRLPVLLSFDKPPTPPPVPLLLLFDDVVGFPFPDNADGDDDGGDDERVVPFRKNAYKAELTTLEGITTRVVSSS